MSRFIVREVRLTNFLSHKSTTIRFDEGITAIIGENGAGKTSIIEALHLALAQRPMRPGAKSLGLLIRHGARHAEVRVLFENPDTRDRVEARIRITSTGRNNEWVVLVNGRAEARLSRKYQAVLREALGLTRAGTGTTISHAIIIAQGGLAKIAESLSSPKSLRELIEEAVGIPDYRKAVERLSGKLQISLDEAGGSRILTLAPTRGGIKRRLREIERILAEKEQEYARVRKEKKRVDERIPVLRGELEKAREEVRRLEEEVRVLLQEKEKLEAEISRIGELRARASRLREEITGIEARLEEAMRAEEEIPLLQERAGALEDAEKAEQLALALSRLAEDLERARRAVEILEEVSTLAGVEDRARRLEERLRSLQSEERSLRQRLEEAQKRLGAYEDALNKAASYASSLARLLGATGETRPEEVVEAARRRLEELESDLRRLEDRVEEITRRITEAKARQREAQAALRALRESRAPECPVCGSPLDEERRGRLEARLRAAIEEAAEAIRVLESELARLRRERVRRERERDQLRSLLDRVEGLLSNYDPEAHADLKARVARLRSRLYSLVTEQEGLEAERKGLASSLERLHKLKGELAGLGYMDAAKDKVQAVVEKLEGEASRARAELDVILARLEEKLGTRDPGEAKKRARQAREALARAQALAERRRDLEQLLESKRDELARVNEELARLEALKSRLVEVKDQLSNAMKSLEAARGRAESLASELARLEEQAESLAREVERLGAEVESWKKYRRLYRTAAAARLILEEVQDRIMGRSVDRIRRQMNRVIDLFGLEYAGVDIERSKDGYKIKLLTRYPVGSGSAESEIAQLSGGEKTVASLAFVLALNQVLAGNVGFLVLDEPTADLDADRRKVLVSLLRKAVDEIGVRQLIVVTHHDEITDQADTVCTVTKQQGVSRVEGC